MTTRDRLRLHLLNEHRLLYADGNVAELAEFHADLHLHPQPARLAVAHDAEPYHVILGPEDGGGWVVAR